MDLKGLKDTWRNLDPETRKKGVRILSIAGVLLLATLAYMARSKPLPPPPAVEKPVSLTSDVHLLEKSLYQKSQQEIERRDRQMEELRRQLDAMVAQGGKKESEDDSAPSREAPVLPPGLPSYPPPPPPGTVNPLAGPPPAPMPPSVPEEIVVVGGISTVSASVPGTEGGNKKKAERNQTIYLPPSFMAATLLSGLDAPTAESARGNPVPALLRVKDLAVLPNSVKADLKGCFVIAEGLGSLADERAHMRAVSLSCLTHGGQAVIDQRVKGFLVDQDGKIGLKGRVVSRMGAAIARSMLAGFFGGMGEYVAAQNTIVSSSPLGTTQTIDPQNAVQYGVGSGLAAAFKDTQKFYLELAKQALPVIEVGATKDITLVIEEGVSLELRDPTKEVN